METKAKLKTKRTELPLFWQSKYEFVAPYNFDECIRRINALEAKYSDERSSLWNLFFASNHLRVDSRQDNGGVFNFKMSGHMSKVILNSQLNGQLFHESENQTHVKVRVGFTGGSTAFLIALMPIIWVLLLTTHSSSSFDIAVSFGLSIAFVSFILLINIIFGYSLKAELYHDLRDVLTKK